MRRRWLKANWNASDTVYSSSTNEYIKRITFFYVNRTLSLFNCSCGTIKKSNWVKNCCKRRRFWSYTKSNKIICCNKLKWCKSINYNNLNVRVKHEEIWRKIDKIKQNSQKITKWCKLWYSWWFSRTKFYKSSSLKVKKCKSNNKWLIYCKWCRPVSEKLKWLSNNWHLIEWSILLRSKLGKGCWYYKIKRATKWKL